MIKNFFKTAFRFFRKNKLMTAISVLSLAIGISATLVIFLLLQHDYSFDKHVKNKDRIFRIVTNGAFKNAGTLVPLMRTIEAEFTGIETVVPLLKSPDRRIKIPQEQSDDFSLFSNESKIVLTNSQYFDLYPHIWLAGSASVLNEANNIVLTHTDLHRYFPNTNPHDALGKTVMFSDSIALQVAGIVQEMKQNSDFKYASFISTASIPANKSLHQVFQWDTWSNYSDSYQCLVLLSPGTTAQSIEAELPVLLAKHKEINKEWDKFNLQPLSDVHFNRNFNYTATKPETLRNLVLIAVFLLSLGVINFINLSTAQSIERAKEIGVRKTLGSSKNRLRLQFLTETFIITFVATILSILLLPILMRAFGDFMPPDFSLQKHTIIGLVLFLLTQLLLVTLMAGFYPAWVLTGYSPLTALKNTISSNNNLSRSAWVRKALTVFQFVLAQVFLICVLLVVKQIQFATNKDLGFQKEAIVNFYIPGNYRNADRGLLVKNKLQQIPEIKAVSFGNQSPAFSGMMTTNIKHQGSGGEEELSIDVRNGDENYLDVYNIPLVAGRNVRLLDSTSEVLINEKALELLQFKTAEDALGQTIATGSKTIVGVMKNFDIASAHHAIRPVMYEGTKDGYVMHIALNPTQPETWRTALAKSKTAFASVFPDDEFNYTFLDETIGSFYQQEQKLSKLLRWAVSLSVLIAGLGLFGLATFTANQRTKEIGIRKVLGASVGQIAMLLLKNLLFLVGIACLIAFPIAWYMMDNWLNDFAYRTTISWWIFAVSAMGLLTIATLVLLSRTIFAAKANPVDSLRDE